MGGPEKYWTDERIEDLKNFLEGGNSIKETAEQFQKTPGAIQRVMSRYGIKVSQNSDFGSEPTLHNENKSLLNKKDMNLIRRDILKLSNKLSMDPGEMMELINNKKNFIKTGIDVGPVSLDVIDTYEVAIKNLQELIKNLQEKNRVTKEFFVEEIEKLNPEKKDQINKKFYNFMSDFNSKKTSEIIFIRDKKNFIEKMILIRHPDSPIRKDEEKESLS